MQRFVQRLFLYKAKFILQSYKMEVNKLMLYNKEKYHNNEEYRKKHVEYAKIHYIRKKVKKGIATKEQRDYLEAYENRLRKTNNIRPHGENRKPCQIGHDGEPFHVYTKEASHKELYKLLKTILYENENDLCLYHREWAIHACKRAEDLAGFKFKAFEDQVRMQVRNAPIKYDD